VEGQRVLVTFRSASWYVVRPGEAPGSSTHLVGPMVSVEEALTVGACHYSHSNL